MGHDDRHARHRHPRIDRHKRPTGGFRASSAARFERLVVDAIEDLPEQLLRLMDNVGIVVEDIPPADVLGEGDEILLGLYQGVPLTERGFDAPLLPDHITLYRRPIEARAATKDELAEIVRDTVVHEVAHHFGIDDDRLDELGWG